MGKKSDVEAVLAKVMADDDYAKANKAYNEAFVLPDNLAEAGFTREQFLKRTEFYGNAVSFDKLIPQPDLMFRNPISSEQESKLGKLGVANWYTWNCANWGTKWDACDACLEWLDDFTAEVSFETAWNLPTPWLNALAAECTAHDVELTGQFAEEQCGVLMGMLSNDDNGNAEYEYTDDTDIFYNVWGYEPLEDECESDDAI